MSEQQQRLTAEELREIAERCEKATEGPWSITPETEDEYAAIESAWGEDETTIVAVFSDQQKLTDEDTAFIASSRTDIPRLLAHIAALEDELRLKTQTAEFHAKGYGRRFSHETR